MTAKIARTIPQINSFGVYLKVMLFNIFLCGFSVLVVAIIVNYIAAKLGVATWYEFIEIVGNHGVVGAIRQIDLLSILFLFIIYPFILGTTAYFSLNYTTK